MVTKTLIQGKDVLSVPMPSTIAYSSGQHVTLDLPRTGIITHIDLEINLNYDSGDVEKEDEIKNLLASITVRDGQARTYFHASDGRLLAFLNQFQARGADLVDTLVADNSGSSLTARANFKIHFGDNPSDKIDPSAGIAADELSALVLDIEWGTTASLWTTVGNGVINSCVITVTPTIIGADTPSYDAIRSGLLIPTFRSVIYTPTGAFSSLSFEQDLPNIMLDKTLFIAIDENDFRENNVVTEVAYRDAKENRVLWEVDFIPWTRRLVDQGLPGAGLAGVITGVGFIDWQAITADAALDLRNRMATWDKLAWSTGEGGSGQTIAVIHKGWSGLGTLRNR